MAQTSSNIDLSNLNDKQRKAVVSQNKRLLVLAGAGSGKTRTLLQKIIWLIEEKNVNPRNILAITFTRNAANEMLDRLIFTAEDTDEYKNIIENKNITIREKELARYRYAAKHKWIRNITLRTFHSLCYRIIRDFGVSEFDNKFKIIGDSKLTKEGFEKYIAGETIFEVFHKILIKKSESNKYLIELKRFILNYMIDKIHIKNRKTIFNFYNNKFYTSLNGTKVRSKSEQYIADWLFRHNIKFEYEPVINIKDFDFKPDFYIPQANLYIEHVSSKSYSTVNKEKQFKIANKLYVKTFEAQTRDTALFNLVLERIIKNRLPADYDFTTALSFEEEFRYYHKEIKDFLRQAIRVMDMIKVENEDIDKVYIKSQKDQHERIRKFYQLAIPLIKEYNNYCTNKSYLDFNDLLSMTITLFKNNKEILNKYKEKFKYILVDEFQDVNNLQVQLLKLLLTPKTQLFCVGDDWQSIYGFRGSNVDYIIEFKKHFEKVKVIKLSLNYRSTESIVSASNEVIKNNKYKISKQLVSLKKSGSKIYVYAGKDIDDNVEFVINQIKNLKKEKGYTKDDILILYRRSKMYAPYYERIRELGIRVSGKTIHAAKGLEANAVFIIGLTEGYGGFPDIWMEDRIYQIVKETKHDLLLEEERRLFYVALTRAKDELFLISEKGNISSFIEEIPDDFIVKTSMPLKSVIEPVKICSSCQKRINDSYDFCPYCGHKQ